MFKKKNIKMHENRASPEDLIFYGSADREQ